MPSEKNVKIQTVKLSVVTVYRLQKILDHVRDNEIELE